MDHITMQSTDLFSWLVSIPAFMIVFFMIDRIVIDPMKEVVKIRALRVQSKLAEAEHIVADARKLETTYKEQFAKLPADTEEMRAAGQREIERVKARLAAQAAADAAHAVDKAKREGEKYRQDVLAEVQRRTTGLAMQKVEAMLSKALDQDAQKDMNQEFLGRVATLRAS